MNSSKSLRIVAIICLVASLGLVRQVSATILASDNFNSYSAGALTGNSGGTGWGANNWVAPSLASTLATVNASGSVDVTLGATTTSLPAARLLGAGISQTFFASYTVSYNGAGTNLFDLNDTFGLVLSELTVPSTTVSANTFNFGLRGGTLNSFGIRTATSTAGSVTGPTLTTGTEYLVLAKLTYSGGFFTQGDLWINPLASISETTPNATATVSPGVAAINSIYFRQAANEFASGGDTYRFDNLILATDWNDIVPVPEPSSFALLGLGAFGLLALRRRQN